MEPTPTAAPTIITNTVVVTGPTQLQFPPFDPATAGARGDAILHALSLVFVMVLMHSLYAAYHGGPLTNNVQLLEDFLILAVFASFQFVLLWMPERADLQAAAFGLWLTVFCVRSVLRGLIDSLR
jgi:hypothetical protein